ncbi:MAG: FadR family transcriptional regulator [Cytophagales bacterium]|nr:FadR family transcriptional regulator [Armatimonadota bacterium]
MSSKLFSRAVTASVPDSYEAGQPPVGDEAFPSAFRRLHRDDAEPAPGEPSPAIYQEVIAQIKRLLREGQYRPGDKLPSERELSERLGVNRNAIREAIRALTLMGVIQTRPQSGSHLSAQVEGMLRLPFEFLMLMLRPSYEEIQELRSLIEVYAAGRAARQRTEADLARIEAALDELRAVNPQPGDSGGPNRRFHRAVAAATHNRLLEYVLFCLLEARSSYIRATASTGTGRPERNEAHERILEALRRRDPTSARRAMQEDMNSATRVGKILHSDRVSGSE